MDLVAQTQGIQQREQGRTPIMRGTDGNLQSLFPDSRSVVFRFRCAQVADGANVLPQERTKDAGSLLDSRHGRWNFRKMH